MIACFFGLKGHVATIALENRKTVNSDWYVNNCLKEVFKKWQEKHPKSGLRRLLLHHDNASVHSAKATVQFLEESRVQTIGHPPYSPDLAPCDFYLFPMVKEKLRGRKFPTPNDAVDEFQRVVEEIDPEEWKNCFKKWFKRMERCIECEGRYFEKM